jgi:hypothetical protein
MTILFSSKATNYHIGFICNKCNKEIFEDSDPIEFQEFLHWEMVGGYGSIFGDGSSISLTLCQQCVKDTLGNFIKINENLNR